MDGTTAITFGQDMLPEIERWMELEEQVGELQQTIDDNRNKAAAVIKKGAEELYNLQSKYNATYKAGAYGRYANVLADRKPDLPKLSYTDTDESKDFLLNVEQYQTIVQQKKRKMIGAIVSAIAGVILIVAAILLKDFFFGLEWIGFLVSLGIMSVLMAMFAVVLSTKGKTKQAINRLETAKGEYLTAKQKCFEYMNVANDAYHKQKPLQQELEEIRAKQVVPEDYQSRFCMAALVHIFKNQLAASMREALVLCEQLAFQFALQTGMDELYEQVSALTEVTEDKLSLIGDNIEALGNSLGTAMHKLSRQMTFNNAMSTITAINSHRTARNTTKINRSLRGW